jgi:ABC-type transport system involved in multi-copper enzyme maturation permease subunit
VPLLPSAMRVFDLSVGRMLWSSRTLFMVLVAAAPLVPALFVRAIPTRINGAAVTGEAVFGVMMWLFFVRFIVPVIGAFYGTALIADEVEEKTITYLFTRPVPRAAVLLGKYLAYLVCATAVLLPSLCLMFFLLVPFTAMSRLYAAFVQDLLVIEIGLAAYGAFFALAGAMLRRPLLVGLAFVFGWEQVASVMPGYLKRATIGHYLQALVPHALPEAGGLPRGPGRALALAFGDTPSAAVALLILLAVTIVALALAARAVEQREYVLDQ